MSPGPALGGPGSFTPNGSLPGQAARDLHGAWAVVVAERARYAVAARTRRVARHIEHVEEIELHAESRSLFNGEALEDVCVLDPCVRSQNRLIDQWRDRTAGQPAISIWRDIDLVRRTASGNREKDGVGPVVVEVRVGGGATARIVGRIGP